MSKQFKRKSKRNLVGKTVLFQRREASPWSADLDGEKEVTGIVESQELILNTKLSDGRVVRVPASKVTISN